MPSAGELDMRVMDFSDVDLNSPILSFDDLHKIMGGKKETVIKWCRDHRELCQPNKAGTFIIHRDRFIEWVGSGRDDRDGNV